MSDVRALTVTAELVDYAVAHGSELPGPVLDDLRAETAALGPPAGMQIGPDEGQLLTLLTRLVGARRAVEVGTFTGYSSLCIARGLSPGGPGTAPGWPTASSCASHRPSTRCGRCRPSRTSTSPSSTPTRAATWATGTSWCPACVPVGCCSPTTCCGRAASSSPRAPPRRTNPTTTPGRFAPSTTMSPPTTGSTWRSCRRSMASPSPGAADDRCRRAGSHAELRRLQDRPGLVGSGDVDVGSRPAAVEIEHELLRAAGQPDARPGSAGRHLAAARRLEGDPGPPRLAQHQPRHAPQHGPQRGVEIGAVGARWPRVGAGAAHVLVVDEPLVQVERLAQAGQAPRQPGRPGSQPVDQGLVALRAGLVHERGL